MVFDDLYTLVADSARRMQQGTVRPRLERQLISITRALGVEADEVEGGHGHSESENSDDESREPTLGEEFVLTQRALRKRIRHRILFGNGRCVRARVRLPLRLRLRP